MFSGAHLQDPVPVGKRGSSAGQCDSCIQCVKKIREVVRLVFRRA